MRERYGFESFRYYLLREMSFGLDGSFTEAGMVESTNAHLANALGNLVSRTLNMTARYTDGRVPEPGPIGDDEAAVRAAAEGAARGVAEHMSEFEPHRALEALFRLVDAANVYVDQREPWKAAKDPAREAELRTTLYTCCQALRSIALLLGPFLPEAAAKMQRRIGLSADDDRTLPAAAAAWDGLPPGTATTKGDALFPRLELAQDD